jgi:hypothetical protein
MKEYGLSAEQDRYGGPILHWRWKCSDDGPDEGLHVVLVNPFQLGEQLPEEGAVDGLALVEVPVATKPRLHIKMALRIGAGVRRDDFNHPIKSMNMSRESRKYFTVIPAAGNFTLKPVTTETTSNLIEVKALSEGAERCDRRSGCKGSGRWLIS